MDENKDGQYHLFAGDTYYPFGGINDYKACFPTIAGAKEEGEKYDWAQIVIFDYSGMPDCLLIWNRRFYDEGCLEKWHPDLAESLKYKFCHLKEWLTPNQIEERFSKNENFII